MIPAAMGAHTALGSITEHYHSVRGPSELERTDVLQVLALHQYLPAGELVDPFGRDYRSTLHDTVQSPGCSEDILDADCVLHESRYEISLMTPSLRGFQAQTPPRRGMATQAEPEWRVHAAIGSILLLDTLTVKLAPAGPWGDESFTLGVIGLTGLVLLYITWYRLTFKRKGLVPWMDLWQDPEGSSRSVIAAGLAIIAAAWLAGNVVDEALPKPTGLILTLVGLLALLNGVYVYLSVGALSDSE